MLAVAGTLPDDDASWAYEVKWDGVRAIAYVDGVEGGDGVDGVDGVDEVRLESRNGKDITVAFPELQSLGSHLAGHACVLDGEIVAPGEDGRPNFGRLQHRLHVTGAAEAGRRREEVPVRYVIFDVLYLDGRPLFDLTYDERRAELESLALSGASFTTADSFRDSAGADVLRATREQGLEGVVAKQRDSTYRPGRRQPQWRKVKNIRMQEVVLGGWTDGARGRAGGLGALLLGLPEPAGLRYVGKVGTGFSDADRDSLLATLAPLGVAQSPFAAPLSAAERAGAHFIRPELVGEVAYTEWTADRRLRHPVWRGLRDDKDPSGVTEED